MPTKLKVLTALLLVIGYSGCSNNDNAAQQAQYAALMAQLASATAAGTATATAVLVVTSTQIVSAPAVSTATTVSTAATTVTPNATTH